MQKLEIQKELIEATQILYKENEMFIKMGTTILGNLTKELLQSRASSPRLFKIS